MVYVSVRGRIWLQAEAMNMVESVGNYTKHRKVPIMVKKQDRYITFFVPSISGESVAHAYQVTLARVLSSNSDKVCELCSKGIFLKSTNAEVYKSTTGSDPPVLSKESGEGQAKGKRTRKQKASPEEIVKAAKEIEEKIIQSCGVEDIGGFLYAGEPNVKRTSSFSTGYMVPVYEVVDLVSVDPQLHSRYALGTRFVSVEESEERERRQAAGQMIYYVEVSSALFTFSFDLDTSSIGRYTYITSEYGQPIPGVEPLKRSSAALEALEQFLVEFPIGAKRTRFNPSDIRWESLLLAVSDGVFTLPSSFRSDYISRAVSKKKIASKNTELFAYMEDGCGLEGVGCFNTPEEAVKSAIQVAKQRLKQA
jgi:CRISPR-associated protein Csa2